MTQSLLLRLDILTPWICGTGKGQGRLHDTSTIRDDSGLPYVPGKHLKGLLRDAVERMPRQEIVSASAEGYELADFLFGPRSNTDDRENAANYFFGLLRISSACLSPADQAQLEHLDSAQRERALFMSSQSTAIDRHTGTAINKSLRSQLLAIPMPLYAVIESDPLVFRSETLHPFEEALQSGEWIKVIKRAASMVRSIGADRQRGCGRVVISAAEGALR